MKNTLKKLKDWILFWIWIMLVFWVVNAWTNITNVSSWTPLTATIWNDLVTKLNDIGNRTDWIINNWWNTGIWMSTASQKLEVNWSIKANSIFFSDWTEQTSAKNYIAWTIWTSSSVNVPFNTKIYTNNSITLTPWKWQVVMAWPVYWNNFWTWSNWNSYHTHFDLSTSSSSYVPYWDGHSYWFEASPYWSWPIVYIADITTTTTLYWYVWFNWWPFGVVSSDSMTFYYWAPSISEKPYFYAIKLQQ